MTPKEYIDKIHALLDHGVQVGDLIDVLDDCKPEVHIGSGRRCYRIIYDDLVDLKRGPRFIVAGRKGLVAFCNQSLKGGMRVKVVKRSENSCNIEPI